MNRSAIECINELVFKDKINHFERPDVTLSHQGLFPELMEVEK
ncbi:hypothetical protein [Neobacillus drentensis]